MKRVSILYTVGLLLLFCFPPCAPHAEALVLTLELDSSGNPRLSWESSSDKIYAIYYTDDLSSGWTLVPGNGAITGTGAVLQWVDDGSDISSSPVSRVAKRFYQVLEDGNLFYHLSQEHALNSQNVFDSFPQSRHVHLHECMEKGGSAPTELHTLWIRYGIPGYIGGPTFW